MTKEFPPAQPHDQLRELWPDVFALEGSIHLGNGIRFYRSMYVFRDGRDLAIVNSIRLDEAGEAALEELGTVKHVVKIGAFHGLDDPYYVDRFGATLWAQEGAPHKGGLETDEIISVGGNIPITDAKVFVFKATDLPEAILVLPHDGGTLVTCDSIQNFETLEGTSNVDDFFTAEKGFLRTAGIGLPWRSRMTKENGPPLTIDYQRLLERDFANILTGHGPPIMGTAREDLRATVRYLFGIKLEA